MHWCHSILTEPNFIAPWQAIEKASELAMEVGTSCKLKIECFSLPKRRHFADRIVRFQDQVQVFEAAEVKKEFHTFKAYDYQGLHRPPSWSLPRAMTIGDTGSSGSRDHRTGEQEEQTPHHFLHRRLPDDVPNYIHHLQHLWRERHVRILDGEYYRLRTWYIHHQHVRQWKRPRIVELEGDGTTWHGDVLQAWRDQLYNDEVLYIAVVYPEVRAQTDRPVIPHADLILVQGGFDRCGGITTVYHPSQVSDDSFTWAISYPRHLSGLEIVQGAEAEHFLDAHDVRVYHDWTPIPLTAVQTHWMLNGHSFVVIVNENQASASSSAQHDRQEQGVSLTEPVAHQLEASEEESPTSDEMVLPIDQLQGVQVFGLESHTHHCFVHWDSYNTILFEVLRSLGMRRDEAVGYHYFEVPLIDQHPAEEAILLQKVGDIPGGSPDRLVLVDITYLAPKGDRPLQRREVLRLPRYLGRTGLLQELGIYEQCEQSDFKCTLHLNNQLWQEDDLAPKTLKHAAYVRVEIPPKLECHSPETDRPAKRAHVQSPAPGDLRSGVSGPALFQIGKNIHYKQPIEQSATFPSLRAGPRPQQSLIGRGHQIRQMHEQSWLPQASMTFLQCATTEHQDEGPVIYWTTWYLHHRRYTRNSESRILRLDTMQHLWYQDLCDLWADVMDPTLPGQVHHVHPAPPDDDRQASVGHLILEQGHSELVPILMTGGF